jgi:hypothetical protein
MAIFAEIGVLHAHQLAEEAPRANLKGPPDTFRNALGKAFACEVFMKVLQYAFSSRRRIVTLAVCPEALASDALEARRHEMVPGSNRQSGGRDFKLMINDKQAREEGHLFKPYGRRGNRGMHLCAEDLDTGTVIGALAEL